MKLTTSLTLAVALALGSAGATGVSAQPPSQVAAPAAPASNERPREPMTAENRAKDIAAFRELFLAKDKSYSDAARAEAETRLKKLESSVTTVSQAYFDLELARIVALADNGHTHYVLGSISRYYNRIPVRLSAFGEDFYVVRAIAADADLLGAKLVSIDGHPIDELRKAGRSLWGGEAAFRDRFAFNLYESPELLHALDLAKADASATYVFATKSGNIERKLAGDSPTSTRPFSAPDALIMPAKLPLEDATWRTALAPDKAPWSLQDAGVTFRWRNAPELKAIVIDMRANQDAKEMKIADALKTFDAAIAAQKPANIVLDMRFNGGGNLNLTRDFMKSLPAKTPGRVFVLTSPLTFSAAISSTGYLKQAGGDRVVIVGEHVGDRQMFWAEGRGADLPNNKGMIGMATQRHDYLTGCKPYPTDCHISVKINPIAVPTLAPDMAAPWTIEAYLAGRDPAIEAVAAAVR